MHNTFTTGQHHFHLCGPHLRRGCFSHFCSIAERKTILCRIFYVEPWSLVSPSVNTPPAETAESRIDRPSRRLLSLHNMKIIVRLRRLLLRDVFLPNLIDHHTHCVLPISPRPAMPAPVVGQAAPDRSSAGTAGPTITAVPDRMVPALVRFHAPRFTTGPIRRLKARGLRIPYRGL